MTRGMCSSNRGVAHLQPELGTFFLIALSLLKVLERTRRPQQERREEAALAQTAPSMCAEAAGACRNPQHIYFSASRRVLSSLPWKTQAAGPAPTGEHLLQSEPSR